MNRFNRVARFLLLPSLVFVGVVASSASLAQADATSMRFGAGLSGESDIEGQKADLDTTLAGDLVFTHDLQDHFAIGAGFGFLSWAGDDAPGDADRNLLVDFGLRPEVRIPAGAAQVYLAGIFGLTYSRPSDSGSRFVSIDPALGYHAGFEVGSRFTVGEWGGVEAGLAYLVHEAKHDVEALGITRRINGSTSNLMLRIGVFFDSFSGK